jgi:hypothetical protein
LRLGGFEEELGFAEEVFGAAGFGDEFEGAVIEGGVILDFSSVAGVGGEHEDFAVGLLGVEPVGKLEAGFDRHSDIAEEEAGGEGAGALEAVGGRVGGFGVVAVGLEDEVEGVGDHAIIVDDQDALFHGRTSGRTSANGVGLSLCSGLVNSLKNILGNSQRGAWRLRVEAVQGNTYC